MRIRTIKPQFWKDDKISSLDYFTRLLFIGLWNYVDDNGVGLDDEAVIAGELFPRDLYQHPDEIRMRTHGALSELSVRAQVKRYYDGEHRLLFIVHWDDHQRINRPSKSSYKRPDELPEGIHEPSEDTLFTEDSCNLHEDSVMAHGGLTVGSGRGRGREVEKEEEGEAEFPRDQKPRMSPAETYSNDFLQFWAVYPWQCDQPEAYEEFRRAMRKTNLTFLIAAASAYAHQQQQPGAAYTSKPATWLRNEGWNNKPQPSKKPLTRSDRAAAEWEQDAEIYRKLKAGEAQHAISG